MRKKVGTQFSRLSGIPSNRSFPPQGDVFFFAEIKLPGGEYTIPGGIFFFGSRSTPGGKTPCECFQAEKVMGGGGGGAWGWWRTPIATVDISDEDFDSGEETSEDAESLEG